MKRRVKIFFIILLVIYVSYLFSFFELNRYQVISKYLNTRGAEFLKKEALYRKNLNDATNTKKVPYSICFIFLNKKMKFNNDVLYENNRLYIPVSEFLKYFGDSLKSNDDTLKIESITDIDINNRTYIEDNEIKSLRGDIFKKNNEYYISFFDLCEILKVNTYWDYDKNDIYIYIKVVNIVNEDFLLYIGRVQLDNGEIVNIPPLHFKKYIYIQKNVQRNCTFFWTINFLAFSTFYYIFLS